MSIWVTLLYWILLGVGAFLISHMLRENQKSKYLYPVFFILYSFFLNGLFEYFKPFGYVIRLY